MSNSIIQQLIQKRNQSPIPPQPHIESTTAHYGVTNKQSNSQTRLKELLVNQFMRKTISTQATPLKNPTFKNSDAKTNIKANLNNVIDSFFSTGYKQTAKRSLKELQELMNNTIFDIEGVRTQNQRHK